MVRIFEVSVAGATDPPHYRQMMERKLADYLDLPVTKVEQIGVQSWIDDMSDQPGAAKSFRPLDLEN